MPTSIIILEITLCICLSLHVGESLRFELLSGSTKCISEEIKSNAMTIGKYNVITPIDGHPVPRTHRITARVTSPRGNNYHHKEVVELGHFAFTAAETGNYMTCFWAPYHNPPSKIPIEFEWKTGVEARDWFNVLNTEMRRLYDSVKSIHDEMFYLREREEEMELLNRSTKSNMIVLSFFSIIIVMSVAALQVWHLKVYFEAKKLL
ncbi:Transmembrane emp24 domain-containing protein p24delta9 [Bienertia sinuspersici]